MEGRFCNASLLVQCKCPCSYALAETNGQEYLCQSGEFQIANNFLSLHINKAIIWLIVCHQSPTVQLQLRGHLPRNAALVNPGYARCICMGAWWEILHLCTIQLLDYWLPSEINSCSINRNGRSAGGCNHRGLPTHSAHKYPRIPKRFVFLFLLIFANESTLPFIQVLSSIV